MVVHFFKSVVLWTCHRRKKVRLRHSGGVKKNPRVSLQYNVLYKAATSIRRFCYGNKNVSAWESLIADLSETRRDNDNDDDDDHITSDGLGGGNLNLPLNGDGDGNGNNVGINNDGASSSPPDSTRSLNR